MSLSAKSSSVSSTWALHSSTATQEFIERVRAGYVRERVKDGVFGAKMDVALVNDGPVTITVEAESQE